MRLLEANSSLGICERGGRSERPLHSVSVSEEVAQSDLLAISLNPCFNGI